MPLVDPITMSSTLANRSPSSKSSPTSPSKTATTSTTPVSATNSGPVALLDTPVSFAIAHARPAVYLALLALRFGALVRDPVSELSASLPVIAAGQLAYAVCCLPVAGSQQSKTSRKSRPGERKKNDASGPRPIVSAILALLLTALTTPAVYILLVLFGAPFLDYTPHTLLCGAHFAVLALFPVLYTRGIDSASLLSVAGAQAPLDETFGGLLGAVLGAWLGAVPIPLDWDRAWQRWPVTIVVGLYVGHCIGTKAGGMLFYGKKLAGAK